MEVSFEVDWDDAETGAAASTAASITGGSCGALEAEVEGEVVVDGMTTEPELWTVA